jgi:hypothetical protein
MRSKETKSEAIFTGICVVILLACAGYFMFDTIGLVTTAGAPLP